MSFIAKGAAELWNRREHAVGKPGGDALKRHDLSVADRRPAAEQAVADASRASTCPWPTADRLPSKPWPTRQGHRPGRGRLAAEQKADLQGIVLTVPGRLAWNSAKSEDTVALSQHVPLLPGPAANPMRRRSYRRRSYRGRARGLVRLWPASTACCVPAAISRRAH